MPDGFEFSGEWRAGSIHGTGVARYPNGDVYEGQFVAGRPQGKGRMTYASGAIEEGLWEEGALAVPAEGQGGGARGQQ